MRNFLKSDIASRIIAFVLAVVVWIYVVILIDPPIDITFNDIPVLFTNTVDLTKEGYVLTNEKPETVSIKVRGSRTMLAKINKSEITAFADLNGYYQTGTVTVPISVRLPAGELSVIEQKPYGANVILDKIITQNFPVTVEITGVPSAGFEIYESIASPGVVELQGPSELVSSIGKVVALVDVGGANDDLMVIRQLSFYNTNSNIVSSKYLTATPEKTEIRCEVLQRKVVTVNPVFTDANSGFTAAVIPGNGVTILGKPDLLSQINVIDTKPIKASTAVKNTKIIVPLDLPEGIVAFENLTEVTVEIREKTEEAQ